MLLGFFFIFIFHILCAIILKIAVYFLFVFNIEACLKNFQRLFELAGKLFKTWKVQMSKIFTLESFSYITIKQSSLVLLFKQIPDICKMDGFYFV